MIFMTRIVGFVTYLAFAVFTYAVPPVLNYAGQVAVNGEAFEGQGLFKFALVNTDGTTTYWSNDGISVNGSEPKASVSVSVNGGLYSLLLGNTAMAGMGAIDPQVFAQHGNAKLRVWFSDGVNGFQQLSPDRPFASVPYAFSAGTAETAGSAKIAEGSINKSMLGSDVIAELNKSVTITRAMLPQDVRDDLNKTVTITRSMLPADVLSDLNRTISKSMLGSDVLADLNKSSSTASPITLSMLAPEVTEKLDRNTTTTNYNAPSVGSLLTVPYGQPAPTGYSLYQRGTPKELVWEEKGSLSVARSVYDGVEILNSKIYIIGGNTSGNLTERFDPISNSIETLTYMSTSRVGVASTVFNQKIYAIGGQGLSSVEVFNDLTDQWTSASDLPNIVDRGTAITHDEQIYLIGGRNSIGQDINQTILFNSSSNTWLNRASMLTKRHSHKLVSFEDRIWAIGGWNESSDSALNQVESYDPVTNSWRFEESLNRLRAWSVAWVANGGIYVGGGYDGTYLKSIEFYDSSKKQWLTVGEFPENKYASDSAVINDKVYIFAGGLAQNVFSNKVFAADLNASVAGVYDLYRKDGNASAGTLLVQAEVADGSVTASKMADGAVTASKIANKTIGKDQISDEILKYLKPEITAQPQAQTVYADTNVSFSVTAEGKYLSYQWKKNGSSLTDETNSTLTITDANATLHDGNYSVVVSNDFGSVESGLVEINAIDALMNGLVAWWKFDETNGTVAYDSSGNGNDGNLALGATWTDGIIGNAISFNTSQYMTSNVKYKPASDTSGQSYSAWVKVEGQSWKVFGSDAAGGGQIHFFVNGSQNNITFETTYHGGGNNGETPNTKNLSITLGWHNVILVKQANKYELFFDGGSLIADMQRNTSNTSTNFNLGRAYVHSSQYYSGTIDDVRIYDRALSASEVQALYNMGQ